MSALPFKEDRTCPKCGNADVSWRYHKWGNGDCGHKEPCRVDWWENEHISKRCQRCGYQWYERCRPHSHKARAQALPPPPPRVVAGVEDDLTDVGGGE